MKHFLKKAGFYSFIGICLAGVTKGYRLKPWAGTITISAEGRQSTLALAAHKSVHVVFGNKEEVRKLETVMWLNSSLKSIMLLFLTT